MTAFRTGALGLGLAMHAASPGCTRGGGADLDAAGVLVDAGADDAHGGPDAGAPPFIAFVTPAYGPFTGGTEVSVFGGGFDNASVELDGAVVTETALTRVSGTRLTVTMPPHAPGAVDLTVRTRAGAASLEDAFTYRGLVQDPPVGPESGGLRVSIRSYTPDLREGDVARFGGGSCTEPRLVSATELSCRVPRGEGVVPVSIERAGTSVVTAPEAFTYLDVPFTFGGSTGGAIAGRLEVVAQGAAGPIEDAYVQIGASASGRRGRTDEMGRIVFEGPDLMGPLDVHVAHPCYGPTSFVGVNAARLVVPLQVARYGDECPNEPGSIPGSLIVPTGFLEGRLEWLAGEFRDSPTRLWNNVPEPTPGRQRVAYVRAASEVVRVTEEDWDGDGGFAFRTGLAVGPVRVVAVAGLEDVGAELEVLGNFVPYALGVSRAVTVTFRDTVTVTVPMLTPLSEQLDVRVVPPPLGIDQFNGEPAPTGFQGVLSLVAPGIALESSLQGSRWDERSWTVRLSRLPAPGGLFEAARLQSSFLCWQNPAGFSTSTCINPDLPYVDPLPGAIALTDFLPLPRIVQPEAGEILVDGAPLEVEMDAAVSMIVITIQGPPIARNPEQARRTIFARGTSRRIAMPEVPADAPELAGFPGPSSLVVSGLEGPEIDGFRVEDVYRPVARQTTNGLNLLVE
jgi:hypothetical protein